MHGAPHQQPEVNYLPRFSPRLISLERYTLSVYRAGEIDLFENLDIVHIRLLVAGGAPCSLQVVGGTRPPIHTADLRRVFENNPEVNIPWT